MPISTSSSASSKLGLPEAGRDARRQCHAHRAAVGVDPAAQLGNLSERAAVLGGATADLLDQHRHPDAPAAGGVERVLDRDVVVGEHGLDLDVLALAHVGGHVEVHDVAGVVLDDVNDAGAAVDRLRRLEHLVGRGRGEHLPRTGGVEHAGTDVAAVHRLVAGAAPGDEPDLALDRRVVADDDGRFVDDPHAVAVCCFDAVKRVLQDRVGRIDELLHAPSLKPELIGQDARREDPPGAGAEPEAWSEVRCRGTGSRANRGADDRPPAVTSAPIMPSKHPPSGPNALHPRAWVATITETVRQCQTSFALTIGHVGAGF